MQKVYAVLPEEWVLRGWNDAPYMLVNWRTSHMRPLNRDEWYVAVSCDGANDFYSPAFLPKHRDILVNFLKTGIARRCAPGTSLYSAQRYRKADTPLIRGLLWSLTGRCNFNCRHCFMSAPEGRVQECSSEELWRLLDDFDAANVPDIAITGGEPLLRPELPDLLEQLWRRRISLSEVFTNAALVTDEMLDHFTKRHTPYFKVSYDCRGTHDYMRGVRGAEEQTLAGIRRLRKRGLSTTIITSVDRVVAEKLLETMETLMELEVDNWWIAPPIEVGSWKGTKSAIATEELIPLLKELLLRWARAGRPMELLLWRFGRFGKRGTQFTIQRKEAITDDAYNCTATHCLPYVAPDGTLLPCGSYSGTSLADGMPNLLQIPLMEAWKSPQLRRICDLRKGEVHRYNTGCRNCAHFPRCGGGCRSVAFSLTGDFLRNDSVQCMLYRKGYMKDFSRYAAELEEKYG